MPSRTLAQLGSDFYTVLCMLSHPCTARDIQDKLGLHHGRGREYIRAVERCPELRDRLRTGHESNPNKNGPPAKTWWLDYMG